MGSMSSLSYWSPEVASADYYRLDIKFNFNGQKDITPEPPNKASFTFFDELTSQAQIDDFLGTANEFLYTDFNDTSMGTDTLGIIINMEKQVRECNGFIFNTAALTGQTPETRKAVGEVVSTIDGTQIKNQIAVGGEGNLAMILSVSALDTQPTGIMVVSIGWK